MSTYVLTSANNGSVVDSSAGTITSLELTTVPLAAQIGQIMIRGC